MNRTVPMVALSAAVVLVGLFGRHLGLDAPILSLGSSGQGGGIALGVADPARVDLTALVIDGRGHHRSAVVGNGGWVSLAAGYRTQYTGAEPEPHVRLERSVDGGSWVATAATVSRDAEGILRTRTPARSTARASSVVRYRFVSAAYADPATGGVAADSTTRPVSVTYENQRAYTGLAATVYRDARAFCPSTAVHVGALSGSKAGLYGTGSQLITIDSAVGVTSVTDPRDIRAVALHECSHERQWMNYGGTSTGRTAMERDAAAVFADFEKPAGVVTPYPYHDPASGTIDPVEHAADCGAQSVNPGGYLGYGGWCSPAQLAAGRRLLLGERY